MFSTKALLNRMGVSREIGSSNLGESHLLGKFGGYIAYLNLI